jgi:hypothetical protein
MAQTLALKQHLSFLSFPTRFLPPGHFFMLVEKFARPAAYIEHTVYEFSRCVAPLARKVRVPDAVRDEVHENWVKAMMGMNMVWVNGKVLEGEAGIFGCVSCIFHSSFNSDPSSGFYVTLRANALLFAHSLGLVHRGRRP